MDAQRAATFLEVPKVIEEATADFSRIFGRSYDPFLEKYQMEDADVAIFIQGAHANTCKSAISHLRNQGVKAGMVRPRWVRPWPTFQIAEAFSQVKAVGCIETSTSYGGAMRGGNLVHEVRASLYDLEKRPLVTSFMAGLGGDVVLLEDFYFMALRKRSKHPRDNGDVSPGIYSFDYWFIPSGDGFPDDQILGGLTVLPNQMTIGATWEPELARKAGEVVGKELSILGINLILGPSLDVLEAPYSENGGDLGIRTFGGDPFWVAEMGRAFVSGLHQGSNNHLIVVGKRFPGFGGSDRLPEDEVATVRKNLEQLKQFELYPFFS